MRPYSKFSLYCLLTALLFSVTACHVPPPPLLPPPPGKVIRHLYPYHYYPGSQVYYSPGERLYFYLDGGVWLSAPILPPYIHIDINNYYPIELDGPKPYIHHRETLKRYPPGLRKEKHQRQREKREIRNERKREKREIRNERKREKIETRNERRKEKENRRYEKDRRNYRPDNRKEKARGRDDDDDKDRDWRDDGRGKGRKNKDERSRAKRPGLR